MTCHESTHLKAIVNAPTLINSHAVRTPNAVSAEFRREAPQQHSWQPTVLKQLVRRVFFESTICSKTNDRLDVGNLANVRTKGRILSALEDDGRYEELSV
jgi:hypothetical protein